MAKINTIETLHRLLIGIILLKAATVMAQMPNAMQMQMFQQMQQNMPRQNLQQNMQNLQNMQPAPNQVPGVPQAPVFMPNPNPMSLPVENFRSHCDYLTGKGGNYIPKTANISPYKINTIARVNEITAGHPIQGKELSSSFFPP